MSRIKKYANVYNILLENVGHLITIYFLWPIGVKPRSLITTLNALLCLLLSNYGEIEKKIKKAVDNLQIQFKLNITTTVWKFDIPRQNL